jgi:hypothetical protein
MKKNNVDDDVVSTFADVSCRLCESVFSNLRNHWKVDDAAFASPWRDATKLKVFGSTGKVEEKASCSII